MTQLSFTVPGKGFSVNQAYHRNRSFKTRDAKTWEAALLASLNEVPALSLFVDAWKSKPTPSGIEVRLTFRVPATIFYRKDGLISIKSVDLDNQVKLFLDVLFGQRLGINDTNVTKLVLQKEAGSHYETEISLRIR